MLKVLIVDDEQDNLELLMRRLTRRGFTIVTATNAKDGFQLALAEQPSLILMDIKMPEIDGYEAIRMLKAEARTQAIPIIALTAHAMKEDQERAIGVGACEYETKPVDMDRLINKIKVHSLS